VLRRTRIVLWRALALLALALGALGVVLPVLPTVPFLLAAVWAASRGWPRMEQWLLDHPRFGADIRRWRERGAVSRRAKIVATALMSLSAAAMWSAPMPVWASGAVSLLLLGVAVWLWLRPER
jgi:uncharacterized membrane protein YbaN (DUF454 family)